MAHFSNAILNRLNAHAALHAVGFSIAGNFFVAFLLSRGLGARDILVFLLAILAGRFALRPLVLGLAKRVGVTDVLRWGTAAYAVQYFVMATVTGIDGGLVAYCAAAAVGDVLYWVGYHAIFADTADAQHRAKQIAAREAMTAAVGVVAPLLAGIALDRFGARATFGFAGLAELLSLIPLAGVPAVKVEDAPHPHWRRRIGGAAVVFATDGWIAMGGGIAWMAILFEASSRSFTGLGGLVSLGALAASLGGLWLGKWMDAGHGRRLALANGALLVACVAGRTLGAGNTEAAYAVAVAGPLLLGGYVQTLMTSVYGAVAASGCPLRATIATEGAWDLGGAAACAAGAGLLSLGLSPAWVVATALPGAVAQTLLLRRRYRRAGVFRT